MSLPYSVLGQFTGSIKSGSYLSEQDTPLFYVSQSTDVWFGFSANDVIEIGAYSTDDQTLTGWGILNQNKDFQTVNLSYLDNLNNTKNYSYKELIKPFVLYKNNKILLQPSSDLNSIGITEGSYVVSYNFVREMAGKPSASLTIKEISPSRKEIKLIPTGQADLEYSSFCVKKFPIRDVAPILLSYTKNLPYDKIYKEMSLLEKYKNGINFLKFAFFLPDDGSVVSFLRNLYEDFIKYTSIPTSINNGVEPTTIIRIQGIKTYYSNFLLQSYDLIADFDDIAQKYISFVNLRLNERFGQFSNLQEQGYQDARTFCYDFFITYFYNSFTTPLKQSYNEKYFGYFKNVLNFGNNNYVPIINHSFLDEKQNNTDPVTLIVKLATTLPDNISEKDNCWVSNFGMAPYTFTVILQNPIKYKTTKISAPNFGSPQFFINKENLNTMYSSDDLKNPEEVEDNITINKNITELNTDYSDFSNFIVFSSIQNRLKIFKNKIIDWTKLNDALSELNNRYVSSISASSPYPYYFREQSELKSQISELINSFDGYESYLFKNGKYKYSVASGSFYSASYVEDQDDAAEEYDIDNRDSFYNNAPAYVRNNADYEEYLTFLNMIGHNFDNIYTYISTLPIQKQAVNQLTSSLPVKTLKEMLYSFGWNVDDIIGSMDLDQVYLNSMDSASYNALSGQERLQTIWNRILVNLSGIYKTKGTAECVNYLMSCYGLPSSMITVREYGGTDYAEDTLPTYQLDEKTYMLKFSGVNDYIEGPIPNSTKTVELKFSIDSDKNKTYYPEYKFIPLFTSIPYPYSNTANFNWAIGFYRVPGEYTGRVVFQMGSGSSGMALTSSVLPIFNGEIFSVMLRRNNPYITFEDSIDQNVVPLQYDLTVQRNENGRHVFYSTSSFIVYEDDNRVFNQFGRFRLTDGKFKGTLDKVSIWDVALDKNDFEEHVNDLNSYGFSGSLPYENLWVKLSWDYPQNMYYNNLGISKVWVDNRATYYAIPNYYTDKTLTIKDPTLYSSSITLIEDRWQTYYPTGSVEVLAFNFPEVIGTAFSASWLPFPDCRWSSQSVYPYQFEELTYPQEIDASKYGPNKFKNKRIKKINYDIDARFDVYNRSTSESDLTVSGESNQLGFFIDPQDSKNKDILRYVGKSGIMELIGDPSNLYSDKYYDLKNKNVEYNSTGNRKTYFNELLTVYKFYFDKSIFQAIKNILPARTNTYTGVVIEPTILERPKYQNKPVTSSIQISYQNPAKIEQIYNFDAGLLWANFNTDWSLINADKPDSNKNLANSIPANYQKTLDLTYVMNPTRNKPVNLVGSGCILDSMDRIQHNFYPDFEKLNRNWEIYQTPIYGSVSSENECGRFMVGADHGVYDSTKYYSGSNQNNHPILYYMLKVWDKYYYYTKSGEYVHSESPVDNRYDSASVYLYKYVIVDEFFMRNLVYFTNLQNISVYDASSLSYTFNSSYNAYLHKVNTFLGTPDQKTSNIIAIPNIYTSNLKTVFDLKLSPEPQYFELVSGYPRNHYSHKLQQFSKTKYGDYNKKIFIKGKQTKENTINSNGVNDGTSPVQSFNTNNVNVANSSNVIQNIPSTTTGRITPGIPAGTVITGPITPTIIAGPFVGR